MQILFYLFMLLGKWIDPEPVPDRPNVLFIAVDDLRPDLGAMVIYESCHPILMH